MSGSADVLNAIMPRAPLIDKVNAENLPALYEKGELCFPLCAKFPSWDALRGDCETGVGVTDDFQFDGAAGESG